MLHAIKHNKINRALFRGNEDSLTSSVFERLLYLPKELMHHILVKSIYQAIPDIDLFQYKSLEFWPSWDATETSNSKRVEPDIFIRTANNDIIIEAKRHDRNQQWETQWKNQIRAYKNEYSEDQKELIYIALGGLHSTKASEIECSGKKHIIYTCDWTNLLRAIKDVKNNLESGYSLINSNQAVSRIIEDLMMCFSMYGFSIADWFDSFYKSRDIGFNNNSLTTLKTWKKSI